MSSIRKNYVYQVLYQILLIITPLITSPYLSRTLGANGIGTYSYAYSIVYYFSLFVLLGVNNHGTREIAKYRENKEKMSQVFWSIYTVQFMMGILLSILYLLFVFVIQKANVYSEILIIYLISAALDINWFYFGLEKFRLTVIRNTIVKIMTVLCIFIFVHNKTDLWIYTLIMSLSSLLSQLVLWPIAIKEVDKIDINFRSVVDNIKPLLILFVPILAASIFKYMDKIMLGLMSTKDELGLYDNAEKIMNMPLGFITSVGMVMLPRISNLQTKEVSDERNLVYIKMSLKYTMLMASGVAFGLAGVGKEFAPWFWGAEFSKSGYVLMVIAFAILFFPLSNTVRMQYLIPKHKDSVFLRGTIYSAIINLIINLSLIRKYAAIGTAIGTVIAELVLALYQAYKIRKEIKIFDYLKRTYIYVLSGAIMYVVVRICAMYMKSLIGNISWICEVAVGLIVYALLVVIFEKIFYKNNIIREMLQLLGINH